MNVFLEYFLSAPWWVECILVLCSLGIIALFPILICVTLFFFVSIVVLPINFCIVIMYEKFVYVKNQYLNKEGNDDIL